MMCIGEVLVQRTRDFGSLKLYRGLHDINKHCAYLRVDNYLLPLHPLYFQRTSFYCKAIISYNQTRFVKKILHLLEDKRICEWDVS